MTRRFGGSLLALVCLLAATAVVVVLATGSNAGGSADPSEPQPPPTDIVTIGPPSRGTPAIPGGFLGLSLEYQSVGQEAGEGTRTLDTVFAQLIRNLDPGQRPVLRIGGDSTDHTWVPSSTILPGRGLTFAITPAWLATMHRLVAATDAKVIPGINLEADSPELASVESRALLGALGRDHVISFEIGNEPSLYAAFAWYRTATGAPVPGRAAGWDPAEYLAQFAAIAHALPAGSHVTGPALGTRTWMPYVVPALAREDPALNIVTYHSYPLVRCFSRPGEPTYPTIPHLLMPYASRGLAAGDVPWVREARAIGRAFRVDELNSVACEGKYGVSNTFTSALWMLDTLFAMARAGVSGVNVHTFPGGAYRLFAFSHAGGTWSAEVAPEYYGMLMFASAAPPGSHLLRTTASTVASRRSRAGSPAWAGIRAWATRGSRGVVRVVLINVSARSEQVLVRDPGDRAPQGTAWRLRAPSLTATGGVTLGGRGFGARTTTGILPAPRAQTVFRSGGGGRTGWSVLVPPHSAAMLTLPSS